MAFCNGVRKVSNWNAGGIPLADMLLLLWWTMHFVLWEWDGTSHSLCQVSKIWNLFGYEFQHIPFKWMHHTYRNIVWHLNIDSALLTLQSYIQFFLQKALISIWMPSLPTRHWLCVITSAHGPPSNTYEQLLPTLDITTCCPASKQQLLSSLTEIFRFQIRLW
jgi:hypothetical protein